MYSNHKVDKISVNGIELDPSDLNTGQVLTTNAMGSISAPDVLLVDGDANVKIKAEGQLTIEDKNGNKYDVLEFIQSVSERLCVLQPNFEAHEKYPALRDAYEQYKMLEKLLLEDNDGN